MYSICCGQISLFPPLTDLPSSQMLDSAFTTLLEGRHVSKDEIPDSLQNESKFVYTHFWRQMQSVLKKLLSASLSSNTNKSSVKSEHSNTNRPGEEKLRQLYKLSLTPTDFTQLHEIYNTWISWWKQDVEALFMETKKQECSFSVFGNLGRWSSDYFRNLDLPGIFQLGMYFFDF